MPQRVLLRAVAVATVFGFHSATRSVAAQPTEVRPTRIIHCEDTTDHRPTVVTGVAITRDGKMVAAATDSHHVLVWDVATGELKAHIDDHKDWVHSVVLSPDGTTLVSGGDDHMLEMWNLVGQRRVLQIPACKGRIAAVCLHPNNQQLAIVGFSKKLEIINCSTGQKSQELDCPCVDIRTVAFSPDGERMAVAGRNGRVRIWNIVNGSKQDDIETDHRLIRALAYSPDGRWLAAAGSSPKIRLFDTSTGNVVAQLDTRPAKVYSMVFLGNRRLATGGTDNRVTIWDLDSQRATSQLVGHTGTVAALASDATGSVLASGSYDTTIRIWNLVKRPTPATAWHATGGEAR